MQAHKLIVVEISCAALQNFQTLERMERLQTAVGCAQAGDEQVSQVVETSQGSQRRNTHRRKSAALNAESRQLGKRGEWVEMKYLLETC